MASFSDIIGIHAVDTQTEVLQSPPLFFFFGQESFKKHPFLALRSVTCLF